MNSYGAARPDVLDSFKYVVNRRKEDTKDFLAKHFEKIRSSKTLAGKAGGWISYLLVNGIALCVFSLVMYGSYKETLP